MISVCKKKWLIICIIFFIILIPIFVLGIDAKTDSGTEQEGISSTPIIESPYYSQADLSIKDDTDKLTIPPAEEGADPSYEQLNGEFTGIVKTDDWEAEGTFSNLVVGNGGIYEAVISGVSAGTTMYFLSTFDDQIFKFTAGSDESAIRVVQFDKNGFTQERIYMELAEGDEISQGSIGEEMPYNFIATDDASIYIYKEDKSTEMKLGEQSYNGIYNESFENPTEDSITTQLTDQGFYNITLVGGTSYNYNLDFLNLTLKNENQREITICKNEQDDCEVYNTGNTFILTGKDKTLLQDNKPIVESFDENNVIVLDFAEQTITLSNLDPTKEILAITRIGYHEIEETQETIISRFLEQEYPYLFTSYDSDKVIPALKIENKILHYEDDDNQAKSYPRNDAMFEGCFAYAVNIMEDKDSNEIKPSYCI